MTDETIPTPAAQRLETFKRQRLPAVVWSAAALICLAILFGRGRRFEYVGLAQSALYEVSASSVGRIDTLTVEPYDELEPGDVVATLDDDPLLAAIETSNTTLRKLAAELDATRSTLTTETRRGRADWSADLLRFQMDEEQRRLDALALKVTIESDEVERERLRLELRRQDSLLKAGLTGAMEREAVVLEERRVASRLDKNRLLLAQTEQETLAAGTRRQEFEGRLPASAVPEPALAPLREAIAVEQGRLREIEIQRAGLVLRSPVAGQVSQVLCRKGQTVVPGEPIVIIAERGAREIVAYLGEGDWREVGQQARVRVASVTRPGRVAESRVLRVGTAYEMMPQRLWLDPATPAWGRPVVIAAVADLRLLPGERVDVRFLGR